MNSIKKIAIILFVPLLTYAQENEPVQSIRDEIESDISSIQEDFEWLMNNKISLIEFLNNEEIHSLYISPLQYESLQEYYLLNGEFIDLLELQTIEGFTESDYLKLSKIIKTQSARELKTRSKFVFKSSITYKSEIEDNYLGNRTGLQQRLNYQVNKRIKIGLARENDVGEPYFNYNKYEAFDHHSMFINYKRKHMEYIVGHYEIFYGQGLLIGQGFNANIVSEASNVSSIGSVYRGIANNNEYNRFRGLAVLLNSNKWHLNVALSSIKKDETNTAGYHRTTNELSKKRKLNNDVSIFEIARNTNKKQQSILLTVSENSVALSTHQQIYFSNNKIINTELAYNNGSYAYFIGIMMLLGKNNSISISQTYFESNYSSLYMSNKVMGISKNDQSGYRVGYTQNLRRQFNIEMLSILKKKEKIIDKKDFGQFNNRHEIVLRKVKKTGDTFSVNYTHIDKSEKIAENNNDIHEINQRIKLKYLIVLDQSISMKIQLTGSKIKSNYSWANSIQLKFKSRTIQISNTVCNYKASVQNILYYHENSINGNVMSSFNSSGLLNDLSILISSRMGIKVLASYQNKYEYTSKKNDKRVMIRVEIRC